MKRSGNRAVSSFREIGEYYLF